MNKNWIRIKTDKRLLHFNLFLKSKAMKSVIKTLLIASFCLVSCNNEDVNSLKEQNDKLQKQMDELVAAQETKEEVSLSPYLKYEIEGDAVTITGCDKKALGDLIIPAKIEGKPITSIGNSAFQSSTNLTSITIPDSVISIGINAFKNCRSLTSITFLGDVPKITNHTFVGSSPTIYRKPEAKGWGDTLAGRPVKLITKKR